MLEAALRPYTTPKDLTDGARDRIWLIACGLSVPKRASRRRLRARGSSIVRGTDAHRGNLGDEAATDAARVLAAEVDNPDLLRPQ